MEQVIERTMSRWTHERLSHTNRCSIHVKIPKPAEETFVFLVVKAMQETQDQHIASDSKFATEGYEYQVYVSPLP